MILIVGRLHALLDPPGPVPSRLNLVRGRPFDHKGRPALPDKTYMADKIASASSQPTSDSTGVASWHRSAAEAVFVAVSGVTMKHNNGDLKRGL